MRYVAVICGLIVFTLIVAGCSQVNPSGSKTVVIGVMPFNEQYIIGEMMALLLEKEGYSTEIQSGMNNAALYEAVKSGQVDMYVDYTSSVYYQLPDREPVDRWAPDEMYSIVEKGLARDGILLAGQLGFRNDHNHPCSQGLANDSQGDLTDPSFAQTPSVTPGVGESRSTA